MKKLFFLLLALFFASSASFAQSKSHDPRVKVKRPFSHFSESSRGKNSKARFRRVKNIPTIDLYPRNLAKSKTTKAPKSFKFSKANGFKYAK